MSIFKQEELERRCVELVARARSCMAEAKPTASDWPDGWIVEQGMRIPAEVVSAFPAQPGAAPCRGAPWARGYAQALARAEELQRNTGVTPSLTVHEGRGVAVTDGKQLPIDLLPKDPVPWIAEAISSKSRHYARSTAERAILVVHLVEWPWPLDEHALARVAECARNAQAPFREIWIANEFGDAPWHVPYSAAG